MKTVRFSSLVEKSGKPSVHLSWSPPAKDRPLQQALKQNRVVTIHQQSRGSKKDYAAIGLEIAHDAQYLIFPKSLRAFADHKIVGIQYELLADSLSVGPTPEGRARPKAKRAVNKDAAEVIVFPLVNKHAPTKPPRAAKTVPHVTLPLKPDPVVKVPPMSSAVRKIVEQALADLAAGSPSRAERGLRSLVPE